MIKDPSAAKDVPTMISLLETELAELSSRLGSLSAPNEEAYESLLRGDSQQVFNLSILLLFYPPQVFFDGLECT